MVDAPDHAQGTPACQFAASTPANLVFTLSYQLPQSLTLM